MQDTPHYDNQHDVSLCWLGNFEFVDVRQRLSKLFPVDFRIEYYMVFVMELAVGYNSCKRFDEDRLIRLMSDGLVMAGVPIIDFI